MKFNRWLYRTKQFFAVWAARPSPADLELVRLTLTKDQMALFSQLQPSEQVHAVRVLRAVQACCEQDGVKASEDLKVAALLHDIGKARYPLWIWERVIVVLGKAIWPEAAARWGMGPPRGWKRPFVIAMQHPAWGAEMASERGVTPGAVTLIRKHQEPRLPSGNEVPTETHTLLAILQAVDDEH